LNGAECTAREHAFELARPQLHQLGQDTSRLAERVQRMSANFAPRQSRGIGCPDHRPDASSGDTAGLNAQFVEGLQHRDMRQPPRPAAAERKADTSSLDNSHASRFHFTARRPGLFAQERHQRIEGCLRIFLRQKMARVDGGAFDIDGLLLPGGKRRLGLSGKPRRAPRGQNRAGALSVALSR